MAGRKERADELARVAEGKIAHEIVCRCKFRLRDAPFILVLIRPCKQDQPVRRKLFAHKPRLFERQIGKGNVDDPVLQHAQQIQRMPQRDLERDARMCAVKSAENGIKIALVNGVDRADAQFFLEARGGVHLLYERLFQFVDAERVRKKKRAFIRQFHAALLSDEQFFARLVFQFKDPVRDGGLRDVQPFRRAREIFQF